MATFVLIFSISLIFYVYFGYPITLFLLNRVIDTKHKVDGEYFPRISIIITAYNEEKAIGKKILDTLSLDYPKEKLEIIVASDGSTDGTDDVVRSYSNKGVLLNRVEGRVGKTETQNQTVKKAKGEIIVFSDATTIFDQAILKKLAGNFSDPRVGCVAAELVYINKGENAIGQGGSLYWKYEKWLKKMESNISSLIGVSGCCYAVRKEIYPPIAPNLISDFVIAQLIYKKGYRALYEPDAICYEETNESTKDELKMRVRVIVRSLNALFNLKEIINPIKYGFYAFQILVHKVLRYLVPIFMIFTFLSNLFLLYRPIFRWLFVAQVSFYAMAYLGYIIQEKVKKKTKLYIPYYFCLLNLSSLIAMAKFIKRDRQTTWVPDRS